VQRWKHVQFIHDYNNDKLDSEAVYKYQRIVGTSVQFQFGKEESLLTYRTVQCYNNFR